MAGTSTEESQGHTRIRLLLIITAWLVALGGCIHQSPSLGEDEHPATSSARLIDIGGFLFSYEEGGGDALLLSRARKCRERLDGRINSLFTNDVLKAHSSGENSRSIYVMIARTSSNNLEIRRVQISRDSGKWQRLTNEQISAAVFGEKFEGDRIVVVPIEGELGPEDVSRLITPISLLALLPRKLETPITKQTCFFVKILDGEESSNVLIMSGTELVSPQHERAQSYEDFLGRLLRLTQ